VQQRVDLVRLVPCAQCNQLDHDTIECDVGDDESAALWAENAGSSASLCFWCGRDHLGQLCPSWLTSMKVRFNFIEPDAALRSVAAKPHQVLRLGAQKLTRKERSFLKRTSGPLSKKLPPFIPLSKSTSDVQPKRRKDKKRGGGGRGDGNAGTTPPNKKKKKKKNAHKGKTKIGAQQQQQQQQKKKHQSKWNNVD
jgi:hypothetical protein